MKVAGSLKGKSWQKRFFIVKNGNLLYYKSRDTVSSELDSMGKQDKFMGCARLRLSFYD